MASTAPPAATTHRAAPARGRPVAIGMLVRRLRGLFLLPLVVMLGSCDLVVLRPAGDIAVQQRNLVLASTGLMLLIIIPVIALTLFFAWHYREENTQAVYDADWHHSTQLEVVIWTAPLLIVIALGALTWISTHTLDPFRPLGRLAPNRPIPADAKPLQVEAVAMDWKWLFIYPELGIATVNELAAPVDRPLNFKLTSTSVMNAFYVPALAGMIYAMPGMETKLHAVINKEGLYDGLAAHYSGSGFSQMTFKFHGLSEDGFNQWVDTVKSKGSDLSSKAYLDLEKPSEGVKPIYYKSYADGLYTRIVNLCVQPGQMCMSEMMKIDAGGGAGKESHENREKLQYDNRRILHGEEAPGATVPATDRAPRSEDKQGGQGQSGPGMDQNQVAPAQRHHH